MLKSLFTGSTTGPAWFSPALLGPTTLLREATKASVVREMLGVLEQLEPDDYTRYLVDFCGEGLRRYPDSWYYADISTVLLAASRLVGPSTYVEIGVRRGRSMAMVAAASPDVRLLGFDLWMPDYAGMPNPGPEFVQAELKRAGHRGGLELFSGDSHVTVPRFFADNPSLLVDLITVDGDHSHDGALADLRTVIPRLAVGGVLVFDDIVHPLHPYLLDVFRHAVAEDGGLVMGEYTELGYGVAVAIRVGPARTDKHVKREAAARLRGARRTLSRFLLG